MLRNGRVGALIIKVVTLGCKVNQCESASIVASLAENGYDASEGLAPADVYVLNTCSVTAEADRKSRQYISKMRKLNADCRIIIVGCSSQNNPHNFEKANVIAVGGTAEKSAFVLKIINSLQDYNHYSILSDRIVLDKNIEYMPNLTCFSEESTPKSSKTRNFIKIQDGCNRFCSYCIIPYLRGRNRSRSVQSIKDECGASTSKEVVLTGIDISSYGRDIGCSLSVLLKELSIVPVRKRLGSFECEIIDNDLLQIMLDGEYCPHFHMSLQSGCDNVLRDMNRHYDTEFYFSKVELIRKYFPMAGITTDIIVGFPTETDKAFAETVEFVKRCKFSDIHVFPYSSREGTVAARRYSILPKELVNERVDSLLDIKHRLHREFLTKNLGTVASVYTEDREGGFNVGYTPNYIKVYSQAPCGQISDLRLNTLYKDGILGTDTETKHNY